MKNKELQEQRMKDYFIQATKEILKSEGLKCISVRNIAEKAGYSYATLYNYFHDVNDLIFLCVADFQEECRTFVKDQKSNKLQGIESIKESAAEYINFFIEYPGIFDLFFWEKVGNFGNKQEIINLIDNSLNSICKEDWEYCIAENLYAPTQVEEKKNQLKFTITGLMLFYLNRRIPASYQDFLSSAKAHINLALAG